MSNRLAHEKSPYLRQHADNPVDWFPWGEEAFAKARIEQKPIFLSIGYSTCHWCHVMAHESFEQPEVAAVLNLNFVPIKLDREERPDLDRVYMTYVQQTTGHGGWPMSVWLTPELKPFFGGTYFPPDDRHSAGQQRPGFVTVLHAITRHWAEQREKIETGAEEVVQALRRFAVESDTRESKDDPAPLHEAAGEAFEKGCRFFRETHDAQWGGFGGAPKFPRASVINFLFRSAALLGVPSESGADAVRLAAHTLQKMAEGGLHDQVGGGFHRYSVDEQWFVPHFEKMLYDQAQIALNYLEARQATGRETYAWIARGIFDYVRRDLTSPQGGFYSAEDADSAVPAAPSDKGQGASDKQHAQAEGAFYVWTKDEIDRVLDGPLVGGVPSPRGDDASPGGGTRPTTDAAFFCAHFDVKPEGNVTHDPQGEFVGKNVLRSLHSLARTAQMFHLELPQAEEKLLGCLENLRVARMKRPRPHLDDKIITAWNGLMISALAKGHQVLEGHPERSEGSSSAPAGGPVDGFFAGAQNDRQGVDESRGEFAAAPAVARPEDSPYLKAATRAAEFIERELHDAATGTLYRSWREGRSDIAGFAEDYAYLIQGLLDLYEAGFDIRWLQWAVRLQAKMDDLFWDAERGGYFNSRADDPTVIVRLKEDYDGAEPAPNSVAAMSLMRLDWLLGNGGRTPPAADMRGSAVAKAMADREGTRPTAQTYRERALKTIAVLQPQWSRAPQALPQLLCAVELALTEPRTVVLAGDPRAADFQALAAVLHERLDLRRSIHGRDDSSLGAGARQWLARQRPYLAEMKPLDGRATAYVCDNYACQRPVCEVAELRQLLGRG